MRRVYADRVFHSLLLLLTGTGLLLLVLIVGMVFWKGSPAISHAYIFEVSSDFGAAGGIFYQAMGTLILMLGAIVLSLPVALGTTLFQTEYVQSEAVRKWIRNLIYSLNGVPTILFGLVGYLVFGVYLETGVSWVTGALILSVMILPTLQINIQEAVESLPEHYREAGMALGLTPWEQVRAIVLPQSFFGVVTGSLLGLARAAGETAAIMFTATVFSGVQLPKNFSDPVPTLQTHILALAQDAVNPQAITNAWGAGLVLLCMVFTLIGLSLLIRRRMSMEAEG